MTGSRRALIVVAVLFAVSFGLPWSGAVPDAAAQISVTAADPPTGEQGALNLNVLIKGKGFKNGAKANFYKTGTADPAGVNVKSTQFVSSTQLMVLIDIADAAALSLFDIQVQNTDGRTGKGTELFSVTAKRASDELSAVFQDAGGDMVRSDGLGTYVWPANFNGAQAIFNHQYGHIDFQAYLSSSGRSAIFEFDQANRMRNPVDDNGTVECRDYRGNPFPEREAPPAWLPGGLPNVSWFLVRTESLVIYTVVDGVETWASTGTPFNVRDMTVGSTVIVGVNLTFKDDTWREFWVLMNERQWNGMDLKYVSGFAKVTRTAQTTWELEPLGDEPRPFGVRNQAHVIAYAPEVRKVHTGGYCDIGDWLMPYKITFTSVR